MGILGLARRAIVVLPLRKTWTSDRAVMIRRAPYVNPTSICRNFCLELPREATMFFLIMFY